MTNPVVYFEILGTDGPRLREFYADLFEWKIEHVDPNLDHGSVAAGAPGIPGGIGRSQDGGRGHLTFYVEVDDPQAQLDRAVELGATVVAPPMRVPGCDDLTIALFADPDGHVVGLSKGAIS